MEVAALASVWVTVEMNGDVYLYCLFEGEEVEHGRLKLKLAHAHTLEVTGLLPRADHIVYLAPDGSSMKPVDCVDENGNRHYIWVKCFKEEDTAQAWMLERQAQPEPLSEAQTQSSTHH